MTQVQPKKLGRYEVVGTLGQGAMGTVYKGRDPVLKRFVALKVLPPFSESSANPEEHKLAIERFYQEASAAARLSHPYLMTVFDIGEEKIGEDTLIFIAMEFLDGKDLSSHIAEESLGDIANRVRIIRQVAEGLGYAHKNGVIHRDIKPANIRITVGGIPKVTDFGLAQLPDSTMTDSSMIVGTPQYMAPEQIQMGKITPATDIYALTAVMYELLTFKKAFQAQNVAATFHKALTSMPTPPSNIQPELSNDFDEIVTKGLAKEQSKRYTDIEEFVEDIDKAGGRRKTDKDEQPANIALKKMAARFPSLAVSFDDDVLMRKLIAVLPESGFTPHPITSPSPSRLAHTLVKNVSSRQPLLIQFKPRMNLKTAGGVYTLINLLDEMGQHARRSVFGYVLPVFITDAKPEKLRTVIQLLALNGIRQAIFLDPVESHEENISDLLSQLTLFAPAVEAIKEPEADSSKDVTSAAFSEYKKLVDEGNKLMAEGAFEAAVDRFDRALMFRPESGLYLKRGDAHYAQRHFVKALNDYRQANNLKRGVPETESKIGACCLSLSQRIAEDDPDNSEKWFEAGMKRLESAEKDIDEALESHDDAAATLTKYPYSMIYKAFRMADVEVDRLEDPKNRLDGYLSRLNEKIDLPEAAAETEDFEVLLDHAAMLTSQGRFDKAEKELKKLVVINPKEAGVDMNNLAVRLRKTGSVGRAFEIYNFLLKHDIRDRRIVMTNFATAGLRYARALRKDGKYSEAKEIYETLLGHPLDKKEWVYCELAEMLRENLETEAALSALSEAVLIHPNLTKESAFSRYKELHEIWRGSNMEK